MMLPLSPTFYFFIIPCLCCHSIGKVWARRVQTTSRGNSKWGSSNVSKWLDQISGWVHSTRDLPNVGKMQNGVLSQSLQESVQDTRQASNFVESCSSSLQVAGHANGSRRNRMHHGQSNIPWICEGLSIPSEASTGSVQTRSLSNVISDFKVSMTTTTTTTLEE
jgi:hypothetical protein